MSRVCVRAKKGAGGACVCAKYEDPDTAERVYGIVHPRDPRTRKKHKLFNATLRTFPDLCQEAGLNKYKVGNTRVGFGSDPHREDSMKYADLPPIEDYAGGFGLDIVSQAKAMMPTKSEVINMVKAGGGVFGARLVSTQVIPRIPWLGDKFTGSIWWRVGTKLVLGLVSGKLLTKVDGFLGAGMAAGFAGDAVSDLVDHFVFKGDMSVKQAEQAAEAGAEAAANATSGWGDYGVDEDELFLGDDTDIAQENLFGAGPDSEAAANQLFGVEDRLFSDVDVMQPDALGGFSEVEVMKQFGPVQSAGAAGGDQGEFQGIGSWLS